MKTLQYTGPFQAGSSISIPAQYDHTYVHIGIQIPHSPHIAYIKDRGVSPDLSINGKDFFVNYANVIEFDELSEIEVVIRFIKTLPADTIIDIAYDITE